MSNTINKVDLTLIDDVLKEYAGVKGSLITILQKAQEVYGYLPEDVLYKISESTGIFPARVFGVATFYAQFRFQPIGKYLIMLCEGTACHVNGAESILKAITDTLDIKDGETTKDGLFSLKTVACLGCCSLSPAIMVNEETYGNLTTEKVKLIIKELQKKEALV
ncbi:MAG TPA: NADH-quinone oxidoreductase subunit NuoE [Oscillospiraceae bacterium]|nr:NADH-quinone oxidoreductase subunit NuoE [Oscillospiraceae bacterium]